MKYVNVRFAAGNAAFQEAPATEIGRILRDLASRIENDGIDYLQLRDHNGNVVGTFHFGSHSR
jgi:hypothetical protein